MSYKSDLRANNTRLNTLKTEINNLPTFVDTTDADATAKDILQNKTAYVNGQKITGTTDWQNIEWQPQADWWDIKKIVEEDEENYSYKVIVLHDEGAKRTYWNWVQNDVASLRKIKFSDGQEITSAQTVTIADSGFRTCSKGYKTFYSIWYFRNMPMFTYINFGQIFPCSRYIYLYNITLFRALSTTYWCEAKNRNLEAIESNVTITTSKNNMPLTLYYCPSLHKIPNYIWDRIDSPIPNNVIGFSEMLYLDYKNISYIIKNRTFNFISGKLPQINRTFIGETIDFENDWGIPTTLFTQTNNIVGPRAIQKLDCTNITSFTGSLNVTEIYEISNIKVSNSWFTNTMLSYDTLIRVLNALYDYSESEDTHTLTLGSSALGNNNLLRLTDEDKAIATRKRLDISIGGKK